MHITYTKTITIPHWLEVAESHFNVDFPSEPLWGGGEFQHWFILSSCSVNNQQSLKGHDLECDFLCIPHQEVHGLASSALILTGWVLTSMTILPKAAKIFWGRNCGTSVGCCVQLLLISECAQVKATGPRNRNVYDLVVLQITGVRRIYSQLRRITIHVFLGLLSWHAINTDLTPYQGVALPVWPFPDGFLFLPWLLLIWY